MSNSWIMCRILEKMSFSLRLNQFYVKNENFQKNAENDFAKNGRKSPHYEIQTWNKVHRKALWLDFPNFNFFFFQKYGFSCILGLCEVCVEFLNYAQNTAKIGHELYSYRWAALYESGWKIFFTKKKVSQVINFQNPKFFCIEMISLDFKPKKSCVANNAY